MKTIVTGAGGFVGLNVVEALLSRGDEVLALDRGPLHPHAVSRFETLPGRLTCMEADVACADAIADLFDRHGPTHVVHAAAITAGPEREQRELGRVVDVNVKGTGHVLIAAARSGVRRVVHVSSGSVYGKTLQGDRPVTEDDPPQPDTLYAVTKYAAEGLCARFRERHGLDVVCARLGSVFGPWERDTGVRDTLSLPYQMVLRAREGTAILLAGREPRRDWIYAPDVASGLIRLLEAAVPKHGVYNLAAGLGGAPIAAPWTERLRALFPKLACRTVQAGEAPNVEFLGPGDRALMLNARLDEDTGFRPAYDLPAALDDYAAWLASNAGFHERER